MLIIWLLRKTLVFSALENKPELTEYEIRCADTTLDEATICLDVNIDTDVCSYNGNDYACPCDRIR